METRLYTPRQVAVATLFGSVVAGFWLIARNFWLLGKPNQAHVTLAIGGFVTTAYYAFLIGVAFAPETHAVPSHGLIPIVAIGVMHGLAERFHGDEVQRRRQLEQPLGSNWIVLATVVVGLAISFAMLAGLFYNFGL